MVVGVPSTIDASAAGSVNLVNRPGITITTWATIQPPSAISSMEPAPAATTSMTCPGRRSPGRRAEGQSSKRQRVAPPGAEASTQYAVVGLISYRYQGGGPALGAL